MNNSGWSYFKLQGVRGERVKLVIHQTPATGGAWMPDGTFARALQDDIYPEEIQGGNSWPWIKIGTWYYTYDPPQEHRVWHRLWETDYVLDGESNGGVYALCSPVFEYANVWISHDMVQDVETYKSAHLTWMASPNAILIKWTNVRGELLMGVGQYADQPLSQIATYP
jgi:hypothetical protein